MKKSILLVSLLISYFGYSQSADYTNASTTAGSNYYDIVKQTKEKIAAKSATGKANSADAKAKKQFERWSYFWRDRVNTDGSFPPALQGWENAGLLDDKLATTQKQNIQSKTSGVSWNNVGPQSNPLENGYIGQPQMGRVNTFWRFKDVETVKDILVIGSPTGGIWKSNDNGATWAPKFDGFAGIGITDIKGSSAVNGTPGVLYATTGDYDSAGTLNAIGVYKSIDYGDTWVATPGLKGNLSDTGNSSLLGQLVVLDALTVVVSAKNDILKTTDGGTTWVSKFNSADSKFGRMTSFNTGTTTNIVCTDAWGGVYRSLDNGENWDTITPIPAGATGNKKAVAVNETGTFYTQPQNGQLFILDLNAKTETALGAVRAAKSYDSQGGYNQALSVRGGMFLEAAVGGQTSTDNGNTWYLALNGYWKDSSNPGVYVHSDHHQLGYLNSGLSFWDAHDGGVNFIEFTSKNDQRPTVTYKTNGVINTQVYTISINPKNANSDDFIMANQDNDAFSKEDGKWVSVSAGDGICSAIDYTNPTIRYVGGTNGSLTRSNGALGYTGAYSGDAIGKPNTAEFVWPLSLDTTISTTLYAGFNDLFKSTDKGDNWTNLSANVGKPISFDNQGQNLAVVGLVSEGVFGLTRSSNGGTNWSTINKPAGVEINSFSIDGTSTDGKTLYATAKAYVGGSKIFKSIDGGSSWTNISGNMPNIIMKKILLKQNQSQEFLFVGTELGVYYTSAVNGSSTDWKKLGNNLPNVIVNDLKINYLANKLFVGTYGRGMWSIDISNSTLGIEKLEVNEESAPKIYPNPVTTGNLNIKLKNDSELFDYVIYNVVGGLVKKGKLDQVNNTINVENITPGIYVIRMTSNNHVSSQKLIIK